MIKLLAVGHSGEVAGLSLDEMDALPEMTQEVNRQMIDFYAGAGFHEPWIAYVASHDGVVVGGGAFKSAPYNGQVEIAYYTLPEFENQGMATATAQALIDLAIQADEELKIVAQTLPEKNASNQLLQKLGFTFFDVVEHPEDGIVWEWHLF
ncbi:GNAT family N-acetyltransferase [Marinicella litoralis]|uniref:Acetyltransferase (GNAT) family protein n=1 Tax=Marinicella litoralis TaxID=644220 RepID=A0A4R6XVM1_9GAMM|nr:GNAT family N-acetyltransferase [Marinicella litoralis]TDR22609.1 acetyltransferase (GNAT) family protein [Marinicella litoralis]